MKKGFTILEVILAITILTLAVGGSFVLVSRAIASVSVAQSKLIASYLAQEGIEIVKNIRDTNWLTPGKDWAEELEEGTYEVNYEDYLNLRLDTCDPPCDYDNNLSFLKINGEFYNYDPDGEDTKFKRRITISNREDLDGDEEIDRLKVLVEVFWQDRGRIYPPAIAQEYLYDWKP